METVRREGEKIVSKYCFELARLEEMLLLADEKQIPELKRIISQARLRKDSQLEQIKKEREYR